MATVLSIATNSVDNVTERRPDIKQAVRALPEAVELELVSMVTPKTDVDHVGMETTIAEGDEEETYSDEDFNPVSLPGSDMPTAYPVQSSQSITKQEASTLKVDKDYK
ncbi:unnamed protein product [Calypogeia fissa]